MNDLRDRVRSALKGDLSKEGWQSLIDLYRADRDAFYVLACDGSPEHGDQELRDLADLAGRVRRAVRESYQIEPTHEGSALVSYFGEETPIPKDRVAAVREFLREIDGKAMAGRSGKDYEGTETSEAEMRFKLGDVATWERDRMEREALLDRQPFVLRLDPECLGFLPSLPAYVTHELIHCARRTVLAPTCVFRGLKRGGDAPPKVDRGWAFFGKPREARRNDGMADSAPEGMVYVVYADEDGYVFDWDWVQEDPDKSGYPLGPVLERFQSEVEPLDREVVLDLPWDLAPGEFDPTKACYSRRGDCIFCYMTDEESYAVRINPDLTVFQQHRSTKHTGFKIKNFRRILEVDQSLKVGDPPGLTVSVDSMLLATLKRHPNESVQIYAVLIRALLGNVSQPPKVTLPEENESVIPA